MELKTPRSLGETKALFGTPANADGSLNAAWERDNIRNMNLPAGYPMFYENRKIKSLRIHRLLTGELYGVFAEIFGAARCMMKCAYGEGKGAAFYDNRARELLHTSGLDQFSGSYVFRPVRGGAALSNHAFGIAVDLDADHNPQGATDTRMPLWVVDIFERNGWQWGGRWKRRDNMHFQYRIE